MIEPTRDDIGKRVYYKQPWMKPSDYEYGTITGINDSFVFVRYGSDVQAKSTCRKDLFFG